MKRYMVISEKPATTVEEHLKYGPRGDGRYTGEPQFDDIEEARCLAKFEQVRSPELRFLVFEAIERTSPPPVKLESLRETAE